jgi:hypothetical protein
MHFEQTRICFDLLYPQLLHHSLDVTWPVIVAIRQNATELAQDQGFRNTAHPGAEYILRR